jgi:alpha-amylase/alpha-mannosidase (GH57 family)
MSADARLKVVLCWHMHQPQYCELVNGDCRLPWTYLHAIKDYVDMAAHLERVPGARAVVNFAPTLLEQIAAYARQVRGFLSGGSVIHDPLLAALVADPMPADQAAREALVRACLRANESRMIERFAPFKRLVALARAALDSDGEFDYLSDQFLADLLMWYHLAWLGESVRRSDLRVRRLMDKGRHYTHGERRELLTLIGELLEGVVGRYRQLAESGRIELSVTPWAHPILPLLLDFESAREAWPESSLPPTRYPGGEERSRWHIREGIATFERHFGFRPSGCWPSEGGVSEAELRLLKDAGFAWVATGEAVLRNSLARLHHAPHAKAAWLYQPYTVTDTGMSCFFRDDGLSDLIGFTYNKWHADDAVADLVVHLERIAECCRHHPGHVVTIILDGENAWEHYPENGWHFLDALYARLSQHPAIELTTFSDCLETVAAKRLRAFVAGSWVYGTFSTWIGDESKNRGWEMLIEAKYAFDEAAPRLSTDDRALAVRQLAVCEGSDWFWWFGDNNPMATVSDFDSLYRRHLTNLYRLLGLPPPEYLAHPFARGGGEPALGGVMRPGQPGLS